MFYCVLWRQLSRGGKKGKLRTITRLSISCFRRNTVDEKNDAMKSLSLLGFSGKINVSNYFQKNCIFCFYLLYHLIYSVSMRRRDSALHSISLVGFHYPTKRDEEEEKKRHESWIAQLQVEENGVIAIVSFLPSCTHCFGLGSQFLEIEEEAEENKGTKRSFSCCLAVMRCWEGKALLII